MMKNNCLLFLFLFLTTLLQAQEVKYTSGNNSWNADSLGNHRAVVQFNGEGDVAKAVIEWRRRDDDPQNKRIIVEDAKSHQKVLNVKTGTINREYGEIYFEPTSGKGTYYVYYMPYKNEGRSNYPKGVYLQPEHTASANWLNAINTSLVNPSVVEIQAINTFNSFYPMEVIATAKETEAIKEKNKGKAFVVFRVDSECSFRM